MTISTQFFFFWKKIWMSQTRSREQNVLWSEGGGEDDDEKYQKHVALNVSE